MKKIIAILIYLIFSFIFIYGCINNNLSNNTSSNNQKNTTDSPPLNPKLTPKENINSKDTPNYMDTPAEHSINSQNVVEKLCRIYYFNSSDFKLYYIDKNISVKDNALVTALTSELQKNPYSDNFIALTDKISIKSANLDKEDGILTIHFNDSYINYMTLGNSTETGLLNALINTYGYNYGVKKVAIYFNNQLYTALKGDLPEGYFTVDTSYAIPFKDSNSQITSKKCRIFYYNTSDDCYYYSDQQLNIIDKAVITSLTNALKIPPSENLLAVPSNVSVISAKLNSTDGILTVDLNSSYYDILTNVGSPGEAGALRSLAYTYGYYYGVSKIIITIDGDNYSGSHIAYKDGEYININSLKAIPYK